ncbi:MAG: DUF3472 domain-containing protein [Planctomycetota bacterium]
MSGLSSAFRSRIVTDWMVSLLMGAVLVGSVSIAGAKDPFMVEAGFQLHGADVHYLVDPGEAGRISLDANNGFFDKGAFAAVGPSEPPTDREKELIKSHFSHLIISNPKASGTAHWYVWTTQPGEVLVRGRWKVAPEDDGTQWVVSWNDQSRPVSISTNDGQTMQSWEARFDVRRPGRHLVSIGKSDSRQASGTELHRLEVTGTAAQEAGVIRARWRPKAIHTQYASSLVRDIRMWVFETQSMSNQASYSPITTAFGYFGGSFLENRTAKGNLNFSMWAASRNAKEAPPIDETPHLLATGNAAAEFGGFGHEGSGVKIRNWEPLEHHPESIIQALRLETHRGQATYSGYFFDDRIDRWVLFAVGRRPVDEGAASSLRIASFCEVPGPPDRERTGDRRRIIRRRGWVHSEDGRWLPLDVQSRRRKPNDPPVNQFIGKDNGWFIMSTGGIEMFDQKITSMQQDREMELPGYLDPDKTRALFQYPAIVGEHDVLGTSKDSATIQIELPRVGEHAMATIYYGTKDCLSFVRRGRMHPTEGTGVIRKMYDRSRVWEASTEPRAVSVGANRFELKDLRSGQTYHFRLFLTNDGGQMWSFDAGRFRTK